jgi:hypothetical protein
VKIWTLVGLAVALSQDPTSAIDRLRSAWSRQDVSGIVGRAARVVVQLPGEAVTAPLATEQAARALERVFVDAAEIELEVDAVRRLGNETVYAELRRRFRVRGSEAIAEQRVFAAFRLDEGRWRLVELRIGPAGR